MTERAFVIGVGMTRFEKPGARDWAYPDMAREAGTDALADAGIEYREVEQAYVGWIYGDSTAGQRGLYELGLTGIPAINVNNNCSTGSTALFLARQAVAAGVVQCALALGFEQMERGSLRGHFPNHKAPLGRHIRDMRTRREAVDAPIAAQMFGNAAREHMERYGTRAESFARIAVKNHEHSTRNPRSQFREAYTLEEVLAAPTIYDPLTKLQCCPTSDGGAAVVVASEAFVRSHGLEARAVEIVGQAMTTDFESSFGVGDIAMIGADMTRAAARSVYEQSGLGPEDVDVIELHDCFSANELVTYEGLGLCADGGGAALIDGGAVTYGGDWVVNPSGGLISKGHPIGATGLAQCAELAWHLRGEAGERQVAGASVGLQHNLGLGGAAVVTMYRGPGQGLPST